MLTTPFSWKECFTPKEKWLGGAAPDGKDSHAELKRLMGGLGFKLLKEQEMPLIIHQHARLFELITPMATVWQKM
uniref:Uncharacterized protein n=2 Tax=Nannochloropsis gaditana TaxID=72520 RepID=I2CQU2_NANGC